jgi:hypothetical protein
VSTAPGMVYFGIQERETNERPKKNFSLRRLHPVLARRDVAQMQRRRIRAAALWEELFFHWLQEPIDRAVADLTSVLDSVLYGFTEVNANENPRDTVLFRCLREVLKRSQNL